MSKQQTLLRVKTNKIDQTIITSGTTFTNDTGSNFGLSIIGSGLTENPFVISTVDTQFGFYNVGSFDVNGGQGNVYYSFENTDLSYLSAIGITYANDQSQIYITDQRYGNFSGTLPVSSRDKVTIYLSGPYAKLVMYYQTTPVTTYKYENLDLYSDIPIKINKSFSELQDISTRNSDFSIGLLLPGSKKNNEFFENFYDVNVKLLNFNPTKRVLCDVTIDDIKFFEGYLRLNKINVKNSMAEYDVTLYSTVANIFGQIGNNLLKDLDFETPYHLFNHTFNTKTIMEDWNKSNFTNILWPKEYIYPIIHNGYEYSGDTVNFSGTTLSGNTRFFTTSSPIGTYDTLNDFYNAGGKKYRINSPTTGLVNHQLKPGLSVWHLFRLIFETYGYRISSKSKFMNTPWFKNLYIYGFYNSDKAKFSYKIPETETITTSYDDLELVVVETDTEEQVNCCGQQLYDIYRVIRLVLVKKGTNTIVFTDQDLDIPINLEYSWCDGYGGYYNEIVHIDAGQSSGSIGFYAVDWVECPYGDPCPCQEDKIYFHSIDDSSPIKQQGVYSPPPPASPQPGDLVEVTDGTFVDFKNVVSENIKQIDFISSIAKKFDLLFIPDPENPNEIIVEPYSYYIGTGNIYDWSDKISYDKGFTVEPAINYIESVLHLTDLEDGDAGNVEFKNRNNRIYGENIVNNPTDFKSDTKKIDTIFSPMIVRKWDADGEDNCDLPLGISYASNSKEIEDGDSKRIFYYYSGIKTKPKLFYWLGSFNPFIDQYDQVFDITKPFKTYQFHIRDSNSTTEYSTDTIPVISHSMSIGNSNSSDSISILFNSELPTYIDVETFNTYTNNDCYKLFYRNRIDNIYDPNTRFLTGYFNLKLSDINNLNPNDIIKIGDKYFTWNKIQEYNMNDIELTKCELIQYNRNVKEYPVRYFKYYYCDSPSNIFKLKTDFTASDLLYTNYYYSLQYDYNIGLLGGSATGYCSTYKTTDNKYIPYYIWEVTKSEYDSSGIDWSYDSFLQGLTGFSYSLFYTVVPNYWETTTHTGLNIFVDCDDFYNKVGIYGILKETVPYVLPTPTPVVSPTPTPTPVPEIMRGSLIIDSDVLDENNYLIINRISPDSEYIGEYLKSAQFGYTHKILDDETYQLELYNQNQELSVGVYRRDYTTDSEEDYGIKIVPITGFTGYSNPITIQFTVEQLDSVYNYEYVIDISTIGPALSPSPTPSITPTVTPTKTITPTPSITPTITPSISVSLTPNLSPSTTPSITPTRSITPTPSITPSKTQTPTPTPSVTPAWSSKSITIYNEYGTGIMVSPYPSFLQYYVSENNNNTGWSPLYLTMNQSMQYTVHLNDVLSIRLDHASQGGKTIKIKFVATDINDNIIQCSVDNSYYVGDKIYIYNIAFTPGSPNLNIAKIYHFTNGNSGAPNYTC